VKELYTKPSILKLKKFLNLGQVRIARKVRLEMFRLSKKTKNLAPAWGVKHYLPGPYSIAFNPQVFSSISKAFS
jgi:hypothetical protein